MKTHTVLALGMIMLVALIFIPMSQVMADPEGKVTLCHKPGTSAEKEIEVSASAMKGHFDHGDTMGTCPQ